MEQKTLLKKKMGMLFAILFLGVAATQAATITYRLTTKVDGRTITTTANVNSAADIASAMPVAMKRAYTTYTFYWDADLTQPVSEGDALQGTVYVDYEFNPPFTVSDNEGTQVYYFLTCSSTHGGKGWLHCGSNSNNANVSGDYSEGGTSNPGAGDIYRGEYDFAVYGDGYALSIKNRFNNMYLYPETENSVDDLRQRRSEYYWQLYENSNIIQNNKTCSFGSNGDLFASNNTWFITNQWSGFATVERGYSMDNNGKITSSDIAWWFEESINSSTSRGMYRYMVYRYYTSSDIRLRYTSPQGGWSNTTQAKGTFMRNSYASVRDDENYTYTFYKDPDFTKEYGETEVVVKPEEYGVTLVYVLEKPKSLASNPWVTLVLPIDIGDVDTYFDKGAVEVNEYTSVEGHVRQLNGEEFFVCHLTFTPTKKIEAFKPYLFKVNNVSKDKLEDIYALVGETTECIPVTFDDETNAPGIDVSMIGVLEPDGSEIDNSDALKFYFASKEDESAEEGYRYGFVRSKASFTIPKNRCYFYVTDNRSQTSGAPLTLSFDGSGLTGIGQMTIEVPTAPSKIYNTNGQLMRIGSAGDLPKGIYIANGKKFIVK